MFCSGSLVSSAPLTVAVTPFASPKDRADMAQAITDYVTARLSESPALRLVEREKLNTALAELKLSTSGLTGPQALQLGKLVIADHLVLGSISCPARQQVALSARLVNGNTGAIIKGATATGKMEEMLALADHLCNDLLSGLNLTIAARPDPTRIETVADYRIAWLTGVSAYYTGQFPKAIAWLTRARRLEPQNPRIVLLLARAYLAANERDHATVELQRLKQEFPKSPEATEAEKLSKVASTKESPVPKTKPPAPVDGGKN